MYVQRSARAAACSMDVSVLCRSTFSAKTYRHSLTMQPGAKNS